MIKQHHTFFGRIFGTAFDSVKAFFSKAWDEADHNLLEFAIIVTQTLKEGLQTGIVKFIVDATPTGIDNAILEAVNAFLPKLLAEELAIKNNSTPIDAATILESFSGLSADRKEQFYTSIAAKIYALAMQQKNGTHVTFGRGAALVESAYQQSDNS